MHTANPEFSIKQDRFEGPFETLVSLVEKRKLHINDISLAEIADEYVQYVRNNELRLQDVSQFVVVAATLMLLKSRSLLPELPLSVEEEEDIEELQSRLRVFSLFQRYAQFIADSFAKNSLYKRVVAKKRNISFQPDNSVDLHVIAQTAKNIITATPLIEKIPERKVEKQRSLKEITDDIKNRISTYIEMTFEQLSRGKDKKEKAASFLAILELYRQGNILLKQSDTFGSISVASNTADAPYYGVQEQV